MKEFKTVLKELRTSRELTQKELSDRIGISRSALCMYELGKREPDLETLEAIADYFNVDIDYLMGRTNKTTILPESYYLDAEARELAEFLKANPEYKVLFDASRKVKRKDIDFVRQMIERLN